MRAPMAGNTAESLRAVDVTDAAKTIILKGNEQLTPEQISTATASNSVTDVIREGLPSAADLDEFSKEDEIAKSAEEVLASDPELKAEIEAEQASFDVDTTEADPYVTRDEFDSLLARIERYNQGAPHKI